MRFNKSDIQEVKNHINKHADELKVVLVEEDRARFNQTLKNILKSKQYYEGESMDRKHMTALKGNVNIAISNLGEYLKNNVYQFKNTKVATNPVEYLVTAVDMMYVSAMEQLGCPDMPLFHFDANIKQVIAQTAMDIHRSYVVYDFSKHDAFHQQRGKNATDVSRNFGGLVKILNEGKKPEAIGKMIAEYQALKERQANHNFIWRLFHRAENKARNELLGKMENMIRKNLPKAMNKIDIGEVIPAQISRDISDALIRGQVELAGPERFDPETAPRIFGKAPALEDVAPDYHFHLIRMRITQRLPRAFRHRCPPKDRHRS